MSHKEYYVPVNVYIFSIVGFTGIFNFVHVMAFIDLSTSYLNIFSSRTGIRFKEKKIFYEVMRLDYIITSTYTIHKPI